MDVVDLWLLMLNVMRLSIMVNMARGRRDRIWIVVGAEGMLKLDAAKACAILNRSHGRTIVLRSDLVRR